MNHLSCQYCFMDVRAGSWQWIDPERRIQAFENKCNRRMFGISYRKKTKQTNVYGNRSISSPDVRNLYCQSSSVAGIHGSAISAVKKRCQKSYNREHYTVDGSRHSGRLCKSWMANIKEWTGQSLSSLVRISDDRSRWAEVGASIEVSKHTNDSIGVTGVD